MKISSSSTQKMKFSLPGKRIAEARRIIGKNQKEFAERLGISPTLISKVESGSAPVSGLLKMAIEHAWGINSTWIEKGEGEMISFRHRAIDIPQFDLVDAPGRWFNGPQRDVRLYWPVPIVSGYVAAGPPAEIFDHEVDDWVATIYHQNWSPHPDKTVCVRVKGDSMTPTILDGGLVAIDLAQRDARQLVRKIAVFRADGGVTVKRLFRTDKGLWIARPDNVESTEIYQYDDDEIYEAIVGKVVWWWARQ